MINSTRRAGRSVPAATDDTRNRILDAAERLFAERGIETVSVRSILAEAGVNVALTTAELAAVNERLNADLAALRLLRAAGL